MDTPVANRAKASGDCFFKKIIKNTYWARYCLKIYLGGIILTCFIKGTSIFLQSMGSSIKSTILALSRDVVFFVPAIIIIANISNSIVTMLWSAIIADVLAAILAVILLKLEFKKIEKTS